ncbi:unnamed protein product [Gongylonema pulchrum]|uniref:RHH_1 domain-containing protein n=1 Tax=Gongylonema pulchrum TaxID=637853 RepID=A0A183DCI5_9BILA|nr:unnamed protein product [Gongylonema pulchrum]
MPKHEKGRVTVNVDEVLRIGSVLERNNLEPKKREAFDWLAENRHRMNDNSRKFAEQLNIAVGDLVMSRELIRKVAFIVHSISNIKRMQMLYLCVQKYGCILMAKPKFFDKKSKH